jgi:hypothetical protein
VPSSPLPLIAGEVKLTDPSEKYFRQCHPSFFRNDQLTSQFVADFPRDEGKLSGTRSTAVNATESYLNYSGAGGKTAGTWAVTLEEVEAQSARLIDDTGCPPTDPPRLRGHTYLDFRNFDSGERKTAASALLIHFKNRGQQAALGGPTP